MERAQPEEELYAGEKLLFEVAVDEGLAHGAGVILVQLVRVVGFDGDGGHIGWGRLWGDIGGVDRREEQLRLVEGQVMRGV